MQNDFEKNKRLTRGSFVFLIFAAAAVAIDQWLKSLAFNTNFGIVLNRFSPVMAKDNFKNYAFAFSWPLPAGLIYFIYAVVMLSLILYVGKNYKSFSWCVALAWMLIFAGAISNIGERIILGYVRDFIYIWHGIFNLADGYIIVGIILLIIKSENRISKNETSSKS